MTRDEILNMPAGVTLDWHIAHFVMGLPSKELSAEDCPCAYCGNQMRYCGARSWCSECHEWRYTAYKDYSDDLVSAWEVVKKLEDGQPETLCNISRISENGQRDGLEWHCHLRCIDGKSSYFYGIADTVPLAICRAALLSVSSI